ncbi:MAG: hypothetical protein CMH18_11555 [Methylophaga sp.]|uniref:hypothetical protein n=1 Tax=Methylophaga sp. TaxID=2024840 RepID=UPI000C8E58AF|nr:hypothetical protein [Methylophaga sp.]MAL50386.1 hypothetical protein [Methylophaga sp.]
MKTELKIGQAYIIEDKPMVLTEINYRGRWDQKGPYFYFTDGRYGFGRVLGYKDSDQEILENLQVAEGVDPAVVLQNLKDSVNAMSKHYN